MNTGDALDAAPADGLHLKALQAAQHAIVGWLLSPAVLRHQESGAAVVNWLDADGHWNGLYPEVCGYYLQFAASAAAGAQAGDGGPFRSAAAAVAAWLDAAGGARAEPLTLYLRDAAAPDWRNRCLFTFDLAIILRGLLLADARWPGLAPAGAIPRYRASLGRIVRAGRFASHLPREGTASTAIPVKWSTTPGVHHVKAAAAAAGVPGLAGIIEGTVHDEAIQFACEGTERMRELHPFLYFIEGWLMRWGQTRDPDALATAGCAFGMLLGRIDPDTGEAPDITAGRGAASRADVIAQALRAGLVLEAAGQMGGSAVEMWLPRRRALAAALLARLSPEGGVIFDRAGRHRNAWASMFAWQALRFLERAQAGTLNPVEAAVTLI